MIKLNSVVTDNHGKFYDVFLDNSKNQPIVRVKGQLIKHNGGSWYVDDLSESSDQLYLDYGQNWFVVGMKKVYEEIDHVMKKGNLVH